MEDVGSVKAMWLPASVRAYWPVFRDLGPALFGVCVVHDLDMGTGVLDTCRPTAVLREYSEDTFLAAHLSIARTWTQTCTISGSCVKSS